MAKIRINGDTSGYIEISAPNVAGSTSITLPATSGGTFLVTDSSGNLNVDSGVLYVDGVNNRVGIGTTSPNVPLEVNGNARASNFSVPDTNFIGFGAYTAYLSGSSASNFLTLNTGSTERARIDSSGRLLVGTPSSSGGKVEIASSTNGDGIRLVYANTPTGSTGPAIVFANYNNNGVPIATSSIQGNLTNGGVGGEAGNIIFNTLVGGGTLQERMRIHADGNISVGTSTNNGRVTFVANLPATVGNRIALFGCTGAGDVAMEAIGISKFDNNSSTSQVFVRFYHNNGLSGSGQINANGASAAAFGSFSDQRLKENIEELPSQYENIKNLRPVEFDYKDGSGHQIGFIAQEMQEVYPDTVSAGSDEMLVLTGWSKTEARLVKALQEAIAKIETLEAANAALETRLTALEVKS